MAGKRGPQVRFQHAEIGQIVNEMHVNGDVRVGYLDDPPSLDVLLEDRALCRAVLRKARYQRDAAHVATAVVVALLARVAMPPYFAGQTSTDLLAHLVLLLCLIWFVWFVLPDSWKDAYRELHRTVRGMKSNLQELEPQIQLQRERERYRARRQP